MRALEGVCWEVARCGRDRGGGGDWDVGEGR